MFTNGTLIENGKKKTLNRCKDDIHLIKDVDVVVKICRSTKEKFLKIEFQQKDTTHVTDSRKFVINEFISISSWSDIICSHWSQNLVKWFGLEEKIKKKLSTSYESILVLTFFRWRLFGDTSDGILWCKTVPLSSFFSGDLLLKQNTSAEYFFKNSSSGTDCTAKCRPSFHESLFGSERDLSYSFRSISWLKKRQSHRMKKRIVSKKIHFRKIWLKNWDQEVYTHTLYFLF